MKKRPNVVFIEFEPLMRCVEKPYHVSVLDEAAFRLSGRAGGVNYIG